jgi:hypothetical protein
MALNRGFTAAIVMALGGWKTERISTNKYTGHRNLCRAGAVNPRHG